MENGNLDWDTMPAIISVELLAEFLGIGKASAYSLVHSQGFPVINIGRRYLVVKEGLYNWIQDHIQKDEHNSNSTAYKLN